MALPINAVVAASVLSDGSPALVRRGGRARLAS
jgi:hypothetical protein